MTPTDDRGAALAERILDRTYADPDDDAAQMARAYVRLAAELARLRKIEAAARDLCDPTFAAGEQAAWSALRDALESDQ